MAPIWSVLANRKDEANQKFWTEYRVYAVDGCPAQPGDLVMVGSKGTIDSCLLPPAAGTNVYVNGSPVSINGVDSPDYNDTTPAAPFGFTNVIWQKDVAGHISAYYATSGTTVPFSMITSGTNTTAMMVVGSGASLTVACPGTGVIEATELATDNCAPVVTNISHPTHVGQILISQPGNTTAVWADPLVQGDWPEGTPVYGPLPPFVVPTTIQPVLIGGKDTNLTLRNLLVTTTGQAIVLAQDQESDPNVLRFAATTGNSLVTVTGTTLRPLLSIKPKAGSTGITFLLRSMDFLSNGLISHFEIRLNATLTGASFVNADAASGAQYDVSATASTGGRMIDAGFVGADHDRFEYEYHFGFTGGTPDTLTIVVSGVNTSKTVAGCTFAWDEQTLPL